MCGPDLPVLLLLIVLFVGLPAVIFSMLLYFFNYRKLSDSPKRTFLYSFGGKALVFGICFVCILVFWFGVKLVLEN